MGPNAFHKQAVELYQRGLNAEQIAFRLNRSIEAVSTTLYRAGLGSRESLSFISEASRRRKIAAFQRRIAHYQTQIAKLREQIADLSETEH